MNDNIRKKLEETLKDVKCLKPENQQDRGPLWKGPEVDGITFSLLSRFLVCRERFRVHVMEGLRTRDEFNHRRDYGNMFHLCEETYNQIQKDPTTTGKWKERVQTKLTEYARSLGRKYSESLEDIEHWARVCMTQFKLYVEHWKSYEEVGETVPLMQEQVFRVPYKLPSGRTVVLRGKWDSILSKRSGEGRGIWLKENKTKGQVIPSQIVRQLTFDLQTMMYIVALTEERRRLNSEPVAINSRVDCFGGEVRGVIYNVVRRPLSGGEGTIRRHQPTKKNPMGESLDSYYGRLSDIISEKPETFFMRWEVPISTEDIERFKVRTLNPILEQLCDWWEWVEDGDAWRKDWQNNIGLERESGGSVQGVHLRRNHVHWQHPFGVFNPLDEGGSTDLDDYLATGSTVGLERSSDLFPELA